MDEMWSEDKVHVMLVDSTWVKVWFYCGGGCTIYSVHHEQVHEQTSYYHVSKPFSVNNGVTWSNIYLCYACPRSGLLMARLMVKSQRYETAWRMCEKEVEKPHGDYWDLACKSPQQRCANCMKLLGTQIQALRKRETVEFPRVKWGEKVLWKEAWVQGRSPEHLALRGLSRFHRLFAQTPLSIMVGLGRERYLCTPPSLKQAGKTFQLILNTSISEGKIKKLVRFSREVTLLREK